MEINEEQFQNLDLGLINIENIISSIKTEPTSRYSLDLHFSTQINVDSFRFSQPIDYLDNVQPFFMNGLISKENYSKIKHLASLFPSNITSFFGFETRLHNNNGKVDYLFAISKKNNEREELLRLFEENKLPPKFMENVKWRQIERFVRSWSDKNSILYNNVLGVWFEFDTASDLSDVPVPGLFIQIRPIQKDKSKGDDDFSWITDTLIPASTGKFMSNGNKQKMLQSIKNLPDGAVLLFVAAMIQRNSSVIRTTIKMKPEQIVPYLKSLGWKDKEDGLLKLLDSVKEYSTRIILHMSIGEEINPKIGLECSFSPDTYHKENRWGEFFDYLIQQGACLPQKKHMLLSPNGINKEDSSKDFNSYAPVVQLDSTNSSKALVRYLSHIKIQYTPSEPIIAKAYPGVRLFGMK